MSQAPQQKPPTSTLAIVALVLSFTCWPLGPILGVIALLRIQGSKGALGGRGLAIAAIAIPLTLLPLLAALALPSFLTYQCRSKQLEAKSYLKSLYVAEETVRLERGGYTKDANVLGFDPKDARRYTFAILEATASTFKAEARGFGDVDGDVWVITNANDLENVADGCR